MITSSSGLNRRHINQNMSLFAGWERSPAYRLWDPKMNKISEMVAGTSSYHNHIAYSNCQQVNCLFLRSLKTATRPTTIRSWNWCVRRRSTEDRRTAKYCMMTRGPSSPPWRRGGCSPGAAYTQTERRYFLQILIALQRWHFFTSNKLFSVNEAALNINIPVLC